MAWHFEQFDKSWVKCYNSFCRAEFIKEQAVKKKKCPVCGLDNQRQIKGLKWVEKQKDRRCRALLHDLHARMVDGYDGSPDGVNHLTFTGGDIREIEEVLR